MNKAISAVLLVVGIILIVWGANAAESIGSQFSEFFTGTPTDEAVWLIIGGVVATIIGLSGLVRGSRRA